MPGKNAKAGSGGFSAGERAAMKERAAELRAEGKKGAQKADGLQAVPGRIAQMAPEDRALAGDRPETGLGRPRRDRRHDAAAAQVPSATPYRDARHLCVPKTSSTSCDLAIFVDQATNTSLFSDAVVIEIDRFG